ncbi:MAG: sugar ABC transporter ATP-binding protein [Bacteroidales bacterium]|nr:sugar ABC transporter ATP-binding protein [Bacteroidales bacterium]
MQEENILELSHVSKAFPGVQALSDVNLCVKKGTVHVLVGENGAGKSTLINIINGLYTADEGKVYFNGKEVVTHTPRNMLDFGVATIHQELSPILDLSIAENIYLGTEGRVIKWNELYEKANKLIASLGFHYNSHALMRTLSISDMQIVEIMKAVSKNAKLIIMDEPTSSLSDSEVAVLFKQIRKLKMVGTAVIYITHKLDEIFAIGDFASILRDGFLISTNSVSSLTKEEIIKQMVGREMKEIYPPHLSNPGDVILRIKDFSNEKKFKDINLEVRKGEILGVSGLIGAGRTELFRAVFGLDGHEKGTLEFKSRPLQIKCVSDAINAGIMMVPEDRKGEGLVLCRSVMENVSLPNLTKYLEHGLISKKKEVDGVSKEINQLKVKTPSITTTVNTLSGGNQQKVVVCRWLLHDPQVLIMDEPTRGIDVMAKYEIYAIIQQLAHLGVAVIMISSEMLELIGVCDRIAVMAEGRITGILTGEEMTQEKIMTLSLKGIKK